MELLSELKESYQRYADSQGDRSRNLRLPSDLEMELRAGAVTMRMTEKGLLANMQENCAAFEAWALVLRLWLGRQRVTRVSLDWPQVDVSNPHYQRFLYRASHFRALFSDWFSLANGDRLQDCRALTIESPVLNVAAGDANGAPAQSHHREARLEAMLVKSEQFKGYFGLTKVDRQFPVGLFDGEVAKANQIFTGGKSAIDIVGVGGNNSFYLFELKADDFIPAGLISELLFYTAVIREASQNPPRIEFKGTPGGRALVLPSDVRECNSIHSVILVEQLHPLLDHPELLRTLNRAASATWNQEPGSKPVYFSKALVQDFEGLEAADGATA